MGVTIARFPQKPSSTGVVEDLSPTPDITRRVTGRSALAELEQQVNDYLLLEDPDAVVVILGVVAAQKLSGDTPWLMIIGPPSGAKTELIALPRRVPEVFELSELTDKTLASGYDPDEKKPRVVHENPPSLLDRLNNHILVFKDFTTILEMPREKRQAVLAQLREIYDGSYVKVWGTGKELRWEGRLGFIAGVTPAIDKHHRVMAILGPRFLQLRLQQPDRHQAGLRAVENTQRDDQAIRKRLAVQVARFIEGLSDVAPTISPEHLDMLVGIAELVTRARSAVERDAWTREVAYTPTPEMPPRFARQLVALASGIAHVSGHTAVADDDIRRVARVGLDGIPPVRRACLECLATERAWTATTEVAARLRCSPSHARRTLEDLEVLDLVVSQPGKEGTGTHWRLSQKCSRVVVQWLGGTACGYRASKSGPSRKQVRALSVLTACPHGEAQLRDIRERVRFPVRSCQRVVSQLVRGGYAEKPQGRRGCYRITPKGRAVLNGA